MNSDSNSGSVHYSESWSLHPGVALRRKRSISAKEQQARAKHPVVAPQKVFESPALRKKAFHADDNCLIFRGEDSDCWAAVLSARASTHPSVAIIYTTASLRPLQL